MKKFRRFIGIFTSAALIAALLLPMCALGGSAAEFKGYTVKTLYDFESTTEEEARGLVGKNTTGLDWANQDFTLTPSVHSGSAGDGKVSGGSKALKVTGSVKADWPPTTFTLKLNGADLKGAEALVFHIAADKQGEPDHTSSHVSLVIGEDTVAYPLAGQPSTALKVWNGETSLFESKEVVENDAHFAYAAIDDKGAWIYISLKAEDLKFSDDSKKDGFTAESVTGLRVGGQHFGEDNAFYIDDVCTLVTAAEPEPEPEPETQLPAPADKAAVNFGGYSAKPLYDFEKYTAADAAKAVSVNTKELGNAQYTITGEVYKSTGKDDGKVGAGDIALKVTTKYSQAWPLCSATLAVDGASLKGAAGIVVHLAADKYDSSEHGVMVHLLTKDNAVFGPAPSGESSKGLKIWNADSSAFEGVQVGDNKISYLPEGKLDDKGSWLFISLDANNLIALGGANKDNYSVENITGLRIAAQNFRDGNALYIDEVYALTPASGTSGGSSPATGDTVAFAVIAALSATALAVLLITGRRHAASK